MANNTGHGHVFPRADGVRARCGGPSICAECARDLARKTGQETMTAAEYRAEVSKPKRISESEKMHRLFASQCRARRLPTPRWKFGEGGELRFAAGESDITRYKPGKTDRAPQWAFDFAWPDQRIAVEYQGVNVRRGADGKMQTSGGHADVQHLRKQHEKHAWATVLGWRILYFERDMVKSGYAVDMLVRLFAANELVDVQRPVARLAFPTEVFGHDARTIADLRPEPDLFAPPEVQR